LADLEFRVLGVVEVLRGGEPVAIGGGSTLNLLAGLLVSANTAVSADALAVLVWDEALPDHPRGALHNKVSRLRRLLGDEVIETIGSAYRLRADPDQLDLLRFERLVSSVSGAATDEEAAATLAEAIGLWRGAPLGNADSLALSRESIPILTERYLSACEEWAQVSLRLGREAEVAQKVIPLVAAHPFREPLVGLLMRAHYREGRQADALAVYDTLRRRLRDELGVDPGSALQDTYVKILRATLDEPEDTSSSPPHSHPHDTQLHDGQQRWFGRGPVPVRLVGRDADIASLAEAVRRHPAVTVIGPGGVGKTALALQTVGHLAGELVADVTIAELGPLPAQQAGCIAAVAGALLTAREIPAVPAKRAEETLIGALRDSEDLLVLDNAEHVSVACAELVDLIVRCCPGVRVVVTSRRPLGLAAEKVFVLAPLSPAATAELLRLRMADHGTAAGQSADQASMAELCRLIEGLPLAVELAAARLRTMSLPALLDRITVRPDLLAVAGRPGPAHQRGLTATLRWSYDLLTPGQRLLLGRLGVVAGPFDLQDAEDIGGYDPLTEGDVAGLLSGLADDSLVQVIRDDHGHWYRLLVPIRDFAISQADAEDLETARARHLRLLSATTEQIGSADEDRRNWIITRLLDGFAEILKALDWALRPDAGRADLRRGVRLLLASQPAWERRNGATPIILGHATRVLTDAATVLPPALTADLTLLAGHLHFRAGDLTKARPFLERARVLPEQASPSDRRRRAVALSFLAAIAYSQVEPRAASLIREASDAARRTGDPATIAFRLSVAAVMLTALGHHDEAVAVIDEAGLAVGSDRRLRQRHLARRAQVYLRAGRVAEALADIELVLSDRDAITSYDMVESLRNRGTAQMLNGHLEAARDTLNEGLQLARDAQATTLVPELTEALAHTESCAGNLTRAIQHVRETLRWTLPNHDVIDTMSTLHLAVVLAARTGNAHAAQLAAAVRDCRIRGRLPTWPFTERDYAIYEKELGADTQPVPPGPLTHDAVIYAGELALRHLRS
jgi:predicted ATPase/DNA-binding SARP family transcriptional activator